MSAPVVRTVRPTTPLHPAESSSLAARSLRATDPVEVSTRATGKFSPQQLLGLIGQSATESGVVDIHALEQAMAPETNKHVARSSDRRPTVKQTALTITRTNVVREP